MRNPIYPIFAAIALLFVGAMAAEPARKLWDFSASPVQETPAGFQVAAGEWQVVVDGGNRVLAQRAKNPDEVFNVVLVAATSYKDVDLSVRLKAVRGELDRGGGLVWRAKDAKNYYVARFNPLENNFRVYKVVDGVRTMFKSVDVDPGPGWHTLRVAMIGDAIRCTLDDKARLDVSDAAFKDAGRIGLWSKADAQTYFDDLSAGELAPEK